MIRLLVAHDVFVDLPTGPLMWAYARRSDALKRYAPEDFYVETCCSNRIPYGRLREFDIVFNIDYQAFNPRKLRRANPRAILVTSFNKDSQLLPELWRKCVATADLVIVNNRDAWEHYGRVPKTVCISNGICRETFRKTTPIEDRPHRVFWRGSSAPHKRKGWAEYLTPLKQILPELGFEVDIEPVTAITPEQVQNTEQLVATYNQTSYVVCTSLSDATPNYLLEAASMGAVPVSFPVGNILEFGVNRENCVLAEHSLDSLVESFKYAREHRSRLSAASEQTLEGWSYGDPGNRAAYFFSVFRKAFRDGPGAVKPFYFGDIRPEDI